MQATGNSGRVAIKLADRPYVPVTINGRGPYVFLLDTGAVGGDIVAGVSEELALPTSDIHPTFRQIETLSVGEFDWVDLTLPVAKHRAFLLDLNPDHAGFIGYQMLAGLVVIIDYPSSTLQVMDPLVADVESEKDVLSVERLSLELSDGHRFPYRYSVVEVSVNNRGPFRFLLDTGAKACLVSPDLVAALGVSVETKDKGNDRSVVLDSIEACGQAQTQLVAKMEDISHVKVNNPLHGYLGHEFLRHFQMTLNYHDSTWHLC